MKIRNRLLCALLCIVALCIMLSACTTDSGECTHESRVPIGEEIAPSCSAAGKTAGEKCADCGKIFKEQQEIAALGHTEVIDAGRFATCQATGLSEGKHCSVCNEVLVAQNELPKTAHFPASAVKENRVEPTCTENGSYDKTTYCIVCGEEDSRVPTVLPALGHKYDNDFDKQCNVCDFVRDINCPHANKSPIGTASEPTCTDDGITAGEKCNDCGDILTPQELLEATGHTEEVVKGYAATCTENGLTDGAKCSVCKVMITNQQIIEAKGHENAAEVEENIVPNDCENGGSYDSVIYCLVCEAEVQRNKVTTSALGHTEQSVSGYEASCTANGLTDGKVCSVCKKTLIAQNVIEAPGHSYDDDRDESCNVCGFIRDVACLHENKVAVGEAKTPTCTENGMTAGEKCADCGEVFASQETIGATGHSYESAVTDPDCVNAGYTTYTCSVCSYSYTANSVAAKGHSYESETTAPNCVNAGYITYTCSVCSNSYTETTAPALGHEYTWRVGTMPTYSAEGALVSTNTTCQICSSAVDAASKTIPAVSASSYTKIANGASSIWQITVDGQTILVAVSEGTGTNYKYDVNESSDPSNEKNENNPFIAENGGSRSDGDGSYRTEGGKYAYGAGNNAILTTTIYVPEATVVSFKLISDSRAGSGVFGYYPANGTGGTYYPYIKSLTLNGSTTGVVPSTKQYPTKGWNNFQEAEIAILSLKAGINVVTFQIGGDNINYAGIAVESNLPVTLLAPVTDTYKVGTTDPFASENGGSSAGLTMVNNASNGKYYEASFNKTMSVTVYTPVATTVDFYIFTNTRFSGVTTMTTVSQITVNGKTDGVTRYDNPISAPGWNTANATRVLYATIALDAGLNEISFTRTASIKDGSNEPNNINISGVEFASLGGVSLAKGYAFNVDTATGDHTSDPFVQENGGSNTEASSFKQESGVYRYGDGQDADLTVTIYVENATQVILQLNAAWRQSDTSIGVSLGKFGFYPADGVGGRCYPYITNFTLNGSTEGVTPSNNIYDSVGWFKMTSCSLAVLDLKAGANVISFKIAGDNINYTGINVISTEDAAVSLCKSAKTISILGDSISTYSAVSNNATTANSTIASNAVYYPKYEMTSTHETWWKQAADTLGMNVLVNNSWSGSRVLDTDPTLGAPAAYVDRCVQLHDDTGANAGQTPDVIAVYIGINDIINNKSLVSGSFNSLSDIYSDATGYITPTTFAEAYAIMIHKMVTRYSDAEVFVFTLPNNGRISNTALLAECNAQIRNIATVFGCEIVDLAAIEGYDYNTYTSDNLHPNEIGMDLITDAFVQAYDGK